MPSGSGRRGPRSTRVAPSSSHPPSTMRSPGGANGCTIIALTSVRAFARWRFTVECDRRRRWAVAFSDPATKTAVTTPTSRSVARPAGWRGDRRVMRHGAGHKARAARPAASRSEGRWWRGYPSRPDHNPHTSCPRSIRPLGTAGRAWRRTVVCSRGAEPPDFALLPLAHAGID